MARMRKALAAFITPTLGILTLLGVPVGVIAPEIVGALTVAATTAAVYLTPNE